MQRKTIVERDGQVIFGEFSWPKTVNTNYVEWGTGKDGTPKEYYTLECLLYLLKNITLQHPVYVRQAAGEDIPIVRRPDRKDLLAYLKGESSSAASIDKSAPLEMPTQVKRTAEDNLESTQKKPRYDESASQKLKDQLAMKYGANQETGDQGTGITKDLSAELDRTKIFEIKKKILQNRRTRIRPAGEEGEGGLGSLADLESDRTKEIVSRERQWRTRTTILQSNGKNFSKNILAILQSVKAREEGKHFKPPAPQGGPGARVGMSLAPRGPRPGYNRYMQGDYDKPDTEGFKIDTTGTYAGRTLKSVMDAGGVKARASAAPAPSLPPPSVPRPVPQGQPQQQNRGKKVSRTPIIIIPAAPKSLITMFNAKEILQDLKYVSTEEKRATGTKRENDVLIQRRKEGGLTVPYRVLDNPGRLTNAEWDRVVAVFVMGQAWQFKGWPHDGKPVDILSRIAGFHLKEQEATLEKNIANWAVTVIQLSRTKRHLDRAALITFWERLDKHIIKNKPHLRW